MKDVEDILFNICDKDDIEECKFIGRKCESCPKKKTADIHPYVLHLFSIRNLKETGYPFDESDMPFNTWVDVMRLENIIAKAYKKHEKKRGSK